MILPVTVDSAIAQKRVCLFGEQYLPFSNRITALTRLYGLRTIQTNAGSQITTNAVRHSNDPAFLAEESARLLPLPLRRYFWRANRELSRLGDGVAMKEVQARERRLYVAAMARLRILADKAIASSPRRTVSLSQMPEETRDLIALSAIATICPSLTKLQRPLPDYVTNFPSASLQMKVTSLPNNFIDVRYTIHGQKEGYGGYIQFPADSAKNHQ